MLSSHCRDCRPHCPDTRSTICSIVSDGARPSGPRASIPASTWSCRPATRTMKNSSWFEAQMARNLARSSRGIRSSSASWSTRSLKSSQESSRFAYSEASSRRGCWCSGACSTASVAVCVGSIS